MERSTQAERWFNEGLRHLEARDPQKALAAFEQAEALYRVLIADSQLQYRPDLAGTLGNGGNALQELNRCKEALARYEEATGIYRALIVASEPQHRRNLAIVRVNEANALAELHRPREALVRCRYAARIFRALIGEGQLEGRPDLAGARTNEGIALCDLNRPSEALPCFEEVTKIYRDLLGENQPQYRPDLARTRMHEGNALCDLNRPSEALARYEEAAGIYRTLIVADKPQYRPDLARTRMNEGNALSCLNRPGKALARYRYAAQIFRILIGENQPHCRPYLALTLMNSCNALVHLNRPGKALAHCEEAAGIYQALIGEGEPQYRPDLARTRMNAGVAITALNRHKEALAHYEEAAGIYRALIGRGRLQYRLDLARTLNNQSVAFYHLNRFWEAITHHLDAAQIYGEMIGEGQAQHLPDLAGTLINATAVCKDMADGIEPVIVPHLDLILGLYEGAEAVPAITLNYAPHLAILIYQTWSVTDFTARVERLTRQLAHALSGVAPQNLGQFHPLAERAFTILLIAALDKKEWDLALTVIGTACAQRLVKLAQVDLLHRAARENDPAQLREYREILRRIAELEILLNTGAGPGGEGTTSGRSSGGEAGQQYQTLYNEYTTLHGELGKLEQTLRQQNLLPDLGAGLFDGAGLRQKLPPKAALLVLVEVGEPLPNLAVVLTRAGGQVLAMEGGSDWTRRLEEITGTLKDKGKNKGRALRDGPGGDTWTASAEANARGTPPESADTQTEALTETLAEQFWQPIQNAVGDAVNTIWLLPTGDLHGLPWQASAPPAWRCLLAPAPWFVRQALDRMPDPTPLCPTAAAPLGTLVYAAPHSDKELLHMPLEERGMRAIWEDAVRTLAGLDQQSEPHPAHLALAGHGDSDVAISGAARIWVGREGGEPRYVGFGELWNAPYRSLLSLYFSSCVVGRTREVNGEPLGLISAGLLRGARYLVGWSVPVDDLGAALFSLLYHWLWRDCADPEQALTRARAAFLTGDWPAAAVEWVRPLLAGHLRDLLAEWINIPSRQVARKERLWEVLRDLYSGESPAALESWKAQLNAWRSQQALAAVQAAAEALAARILDRRVRFPFRYIGYFALGFGATGHLPANG